MCEWTISLKNKKGFLFLTNDYDDELLMCAGVFKETIHQRIKWLNPLSGTFRVIQQCGINPFEFVSSPTESCQKKIYSVLQELGFIELYQNSKNQPSPILKMGNEHIAKQLINECRFENSFFATSKLNVLKVTSKSESELENATNPTCHIAKQQIHQDDVNRSAQYLQWIKHLFEEFLAENQNLNLSSNPNRNPNFKTPNIWNLKSEIL